MDAAPDASDLVDFVPERSQLARVGRRQTAAKVDSGGAPPAWIAMGAIALALGLGLSLALPPATLVTHGAVTKHPGAVAASASASASPNPSAADPLNPLAWRDEPGDH